MKKKSSCYQEAQKTIIKSKHKLIHLIGDYGIGKTYLLNSIINDKWKKEKVNNFDNFIFNEKEVELINSFEKNQDFQKRVKKYERLEKIQKLLWKFLWLLIAIVPVVVPLSNNAWIKATIGWCSVFVLIFFVFLITSVWKKMMNRKKNNEIWIFHNVDRFKWDVISKLFQWADLNKTNSKKIIFVYSTINLNERYKEKFGFDPSNLEIGIEKFVDEYVDLNLHKDDIAHKILQDMYIEHDLIDKLDHSIIKSGIFKF